VVEMTEQTATEQMTQQMTEQADQNYDAVVVGGGAAGLNAALMLVRARRSVLVVDSRAPRNAPADHMHGYLSRDGLSPRELLEIGRDEVLGYGGVVVTDFVEKAERSDGGFTIALASGATVQTRQLLVTTGLTDELPDIPGVRQHWGRDVHVCPYCHGWEVQDQAIAVLGTDDRSIHHALLIRQWSDDVVFLSHTMRDLTEDERARLHARGIRIVSGEVQRLIIQDGRLTGVEVAYGSVIESTALFLVPRLVPNDSLLRSLGCETGETDWVTVSQSMGQSGRTSVAGVWAAGNVVDATAGVIAAAGAGATTAAAINAELVSADVEAALRDAAISDRRSG
jgi:thioredoxin reductase